MKRPLSMTRHAQAVRRHIEKLKATGKYEAHLKAAREGMRRQRKEKAEKGEEWIYSLANVYQAMMDRCYSPRVKSYKDYGGRGITVCDKWRGNWPEFKEWALSNGWQKKLQIDRVDNEGNYEPSNCRFVTCAENNRNRRSTKLTWEKVFEIRHLALEGYSGVEIAKIFGISQAQTSKIKKGSQWQQPP